MSSGEQDVMDMEVEMVREEARGEERRSNGKEGSSSVMRWERFLPRMVVSVLLVEADDSTRQIISAFLRKCNYKVAAVPDGLKAWEVLKGRSRNIDLILTEVELPSISGFALLTLIMEDDICKDIPVIMMSSYDSIGTVHKCMMRGASDFLMKPIRINEMKNLWQHVWRRKSPTIGHGIDPQVESVAQDKVEASAENNAASDHSSGSKALLDREEGCFKKGGDAQSSCMNPDLEAKSAHAEEVSQDRSRSEKMKSSFGNTEDPQDDGAGKNLCTHANIVADEYHCKDRSTMTQRVPIDHLSFQPSEKTAMATGSSREAIDLIGTFDNNGGYGDPGLNNRSKFFESRELNLSLRRFQPGGFESNSNQNNVLIRSDASAFSRYISKQVQVQPIPRESTMNTGERSSEDGNVGERLITPSSSPIRSIQREAALTKFRLKRKERCYEKKVRYESRKKLADQRPRVKGQFVRRVAPNSPPANPVAAYASAGA